MRRLACSAGRGVAIASAFAASIGRSALIAIIDLYRAVLSPLITATIGPACRFEPTCSAYAREALGRHGIADGGRLALGRLLRCRPAGGWGYDPVPQNPVAQNLVAKVPAPHEPRARALT
jgi:putative membrane protein insertion efficiency factor